MSSPAPLRLVLSRAEEAKALPTFDAARPAPLEVFPGDKALPFAAGASFAVHAAVLLWMTVNGVFGEERAAGTAEDLILIEGITVELVESAPVPETPPSEAMAEPEAPAEVESPKPPELQPPPEPATEAIPEALPPPDAETGERTARPEDAVTVPEVTEAADVPTPRKKPEQPEVAAAATPDPQEQREVPKPAPAQPPSSPAAAQSTARSGGAGGGGASQTAGNAAASAYRAKVAAQLKRKRFYPNAARRDRLTGSATVSFTLNASGTVTAVRVVRSSGERILDDAAKEMVQRGSPYPPIPPGLGPTITIQAPIAFDLPR